MQSKCYYGNFTMSFAIQKSNRLEVFCKIVFLKILQNSQENTCTRVSFLITLQASECNFNKKGTLAQAVSSCEFCKIFKKTFFYRSHLVAAFDNNNPFLHALNNRILMKLFTVELQYCKYCMKDIECNTCRVKGSESLIIDILIL